jgi:hypothetical protein
VRLNTKAGMEYRRLGRSGPDQPRPGLGTLTHTPLFVLCGVNRE